MYSMEEKLTFMLVLFSFLFATCGIITLLIEKSDVQIIVGVLALGFGFLIFISAFMLDTLDGIRKDQQARD
jgi:hypothetical protein